MLKNSSASGVAVWCAIIGLISAPAFAQERPSPPPLVVPETQPSPDAALVSPLLSDDGAVTFSLYAPGAQQVVLDSLELVYLAANGGPLAPPILVKDANGVWTLTLRPPPGTYRYAFMVDGVRVVDPRNPNTTGANDAASSIVHIDGLIAEDRRDVPHGAVSEVYYPSPVFGQTRRMHVYTPPGYERSTRRYPVLYLLHGNGDSDEAWSTTGRVNFILDNLIASGQAEPMIVVMPAGHWAGQGSVLEMLLSRTPGSDEFSRDFTEAVLPYVERSYRVRPGARSRAIAGLSMGGAQAMTLALTRPGMFDSVGVFSAGFLGNAGEAYSPEQMRGARELGLFYFAFGTEDFVTPYTRYTLDLFDYYDVPTVRHETGGGHTWTNWRAYLQDFAPRLFR